MASTNDSSTNIVLQLCKNNCGFYGNTAFDGFCSQCYTEQKKKSKEIEGQQQPHISVEMKEEKVVIESETTTTTTSSMPVESLLLSSQSNYSSKKIRCPNCKKF